MRKWLREQTADTQAARRELAEVAAHEPALLHEEVALLREEIAGLREENAERKSAFFLSPALFLPSCFLLQQASRANGGNLSANV